MRYMLFFGWIFLFVKFPVTVKAQEVIASSGNYYQNEAGSISWTLGETLIDTYMSTDFILTQGFQQPVLLASTIINEPDLDFQITAFPNPTRGYVNISMDLLQAEKLFYSVYDMQGRLIISNSLEGPQTRISFDNFSSGIFFIKITHYEKPLKVFKIIKE